MPTPVTDLGNPEINLLHAVWSMTIEDLRGEAPVFGNLPSEYRGLPVGERARIERKAAKLNAQQFIAGRPEFDKLVKMTAEATNTAITPERMREAMRAHDL